MIKEGTVEDLYTDDHYQRRKSDKNGIYSSLKYPTPGKESCRREEAGKVGSLAFLAYFAVTLKADSLARAECPPTPKGPPYPQTKLQFSPIQSYAEVCMEIWAGHSLMEHESLWKALPD